MFSFLLPSYHNVMLCLFNTPPISIKAQTIIVYRISHSSPISIQVKFFYLFHRHSLQILRCTVLKVLFSPFYFIER